MNSTLSNRFYYGIKPFLPRSLRLALRRMRFRRIARTCQDRWPILESAAKAPRDWPGWPEGKQFAFVITHDVEDSIGLHQCRELMELERAHGFRSCFNFIPEGPYRVSEELLEELKSNHFEVGVHDLHHDGRLYHSRKEFAANAVRINQYLRAWGAVGFRSGFMLHQPEWLHDLNVSYDGSMFDTDPFEPQPDGAETIFPFWVDAPEPETGAARKFRGYVELPYTLAQDSTLFLIKQERTIDLWKRKLDWVAACGGMALVNVHPDYINFSKFWSANGNYPASLYEDLLVYITTQYKDSCWHALPKEVCAHFQQYRAQLDCPSAKIKPASKLLVSESPWRA